ncbi:MAG: M50 family metallopeptidase [Ruminococcus sp.]|nr:M50 family metallopeptidase [Ruminococcus sp.]
MKKNSKKKDPPSLGNIIMIGFGAVTGFVIAMVTDINGDDGGISLLRLMSAIAVFLLSVLFGLMIHEAGHLVCGLKTGYEFVSFRVGSFTLVKENGRLVRRKFTIAGTGGQCVMTHELVNDPENVPYFWYHFGGGFFNLLCAVSGLALFFITSDNTARMLMAIFAAVSLMLALMNLIPIKAMGVPNDGYNIYLLHKSPKNRKMILNNIAANGLQYKGSRLKDMPEELFSDADPDGGIYETAQALLCANRELDRHNFESAKEIYERVLKNPDLVGIYKNECNCELMFTDIVTGESKEKILENYDKDMQTYIKQTEKTYITRKRLMYAYYLITERDNDKAEAEYQAALKMKDTYPCKGEYDSEMEIIEFVKENYGDGSSQLSQ